MSLSAAFQHADALCQAGTSAEALDACRRLALAVEAAGLFSANEGAEDIPTPHLKYLLVPAMLGQQLAAGRATDPAARAAAVSEALSCFMELLQRCDSYGLLSEAAQRALHAAEDGQPVDPNSRRTAKIERHKRTSAVRGLLQHLRRQRREAPMDEEDGRQVVPVGGMGAWDEEDERQLWLLQLEAAMLDALDQLELLRQEQQLLAHMQARAAAAGGGQSLASTSGRQDGKQQQQADAAAQEAMRSKLAGIAAQLAGSDRQRMQQEVFRPSHILPTMSVEQQGLIELRNAQRRQQREQEAQTWEQQRRAQLTAEQAEQEEVDAARRWDDFKDANPAGSGNSKLRPCA